MTASLGRSLAALLGSVVLAAPASSRADGAGPDASAPRGRPCCALAANMAVDLGSAHVPIIIGGVISPRGLGRHAYLSDGELTENNGLVYTRRGGFVDLAHTRDNADIAAYLALRLRPLLARGEGVLRLGAKGGARRIVVTRAVPAAELKETSARIAVRAAFALSVWTELVQYYGLTKFRGAAETYSSFTPDDLYSNLLGAHLGAMALDSAAPYDGAMDVALATALGTLGALPKAETRRTLDRLAGRWWNPEYAWPAREITVVRRYEIGPTVAPLLVPADVAAGAGAPVALAVPQIDETGASLGRYYRIEIDPDAGAMIRFPPEERGKRIGEEDLPRLVDEVHRAFDADATVPFAPRGMPEGTGEDGLRGPVAHYLSGIRVFELEGLGGAALSSDGTPARGVGGGELRLVRGDTRGGDFTILSLGFGGAPVRGLITSFHFLEADALWFCHDPDGDGVRPPLVSLLGPCAPGEWLGVGGALGEALHDGDTGRTAIRPIRLAGVLNLLGNGQRATYDAVRVLASVGGEVEHVWSVEGGPRTLPRAEAKLSVLARTPSRHVEVRAVAGYRVDGADLHDGVFESDVRLVYNVALGSAPATSARDRLNAWGLAQVGVEGSYSYWSRPENAFPEIAPAFVSTEHAATLQILATATLGFEGLVF